MWKPDNWPKNPCDVCEKRDEDAYGLVCSLTCHRGLVWEAGQAWAEKMQKAMIEELERMGKNEKHNTIKLFWKFAADHFEREQ